MSCLNPDLVQQAELDRLRSRIEDLEYDLWKYCRNGGGCLNSCPHRYPHEATQWCARCREELIAHDDESCRNYRLMMRHHRNDEYLPATEEEARAELDRIAPLVGG